MSIAEPKSREEIERAFATLLREQKKQASQIETRAEAAEREREREVVDRVSGYTVENIVKGLAELQLSFSSTLDSLSERMEKESDKVSEMRRAIEVEDRRLADLEGLTITAEALALVRQDHARRVAEIEAQKIEQSKQLEQEITDTRAAWAKEEQARLEEAAAFAETLKKDREQAEADHTYALAREDKLRADAEQDRRRLLERELREARALKEKDWSARETALDARAEEIASLRTRIAGMDAALEDAEKRAREKAISKVRKEAEHKAELLARDSASAAQVFELKIASLEQRVEAQRAEIAELEGRLSAALGQAQKLATEALKSGRAENKS